MKQIDIFMTITYQTKINSANLLILAVITEHIKNVFSEAELEENVVCRNFRHTTQHGAIQGKTQDNSVKYYHLDVIISELSQFLGQLRA
jgi:hypothetical protein